MSVREVCCLSILNISKLHPWGGNQHFSIIFDIQNFLKKKSFCDLIFDLGGRERKRLTSAIPIGARAPKRNEPLLDLRPVCKLEFIHCGSVENKHKICA